MKKKMMAVLLMALLVCMAITGCTEANQVSNNISQEADNFNVTRKLTVVNARTDTILLELTGTFALKNNTANELEVIIETEEGKYKKDLVYLNDYTMYVVEDVSGADVDKYHDVGVKTINKFNPIPYSTLKNSYFVVYRRGLGNI